MNGLIVKKDVCTLSIGKWCNNALKKLALSIIWKFAKRAKTYKSTVDFEKQEISRSSEIALDKSGRQV